MKFTYTNLCFTSKKKKIKIKCDIVHLKLLDMYTIHN